MKNLRIKYQKLDYAKYISHLDTVRLFDRAIRRSDIPIVYSKGFNPKPSMTFAHPLSVGISSECEYVQFELDEQLDINKFIEIFNENLPDKLKIIDARYVECAKSLMAIVQKAEYNIYFKSSIDLSQKIYNILGQHEIIVTKRSKGKETQLDIKPMIYEYKTTIEKDRTILEVLLACGSINNLNPQLIVDAINSKLDNLIDDYSIHRVGLFKEDKLDLLGEC